MIYFFSKYGSSKKIAMQIASGLKEEAVDLSSCKSIDSHSVPVIVLPVYAGRFYRGRRTLAMLKKAGISKFILISVGISNPERKETRTSVLNAAHIAFPGIETILFFCGGILDFARLDGKDRLMMFALKKMIEKNPEAAENGEILAAWGQKIERMDPLKMDAAVLEIARIRSQT